ncbi:MAG: M48 family metallopeptidase [Planctomycetota bacterium]
MKIADYDELVAKNEQLAADSPAWYRVQVIGFAGLGFGVVLLALLAGLALIVCAVLMIVVGKVVLAKVAIVCGLFGGSLTWAVLRGVWVRFPPPDGIALQRQDAPELFDEVERLRAAAGTPVVHGIILSSQLNAMMAQRPRLGLFGWYRNELVLGLPLLRQLDVAQARSVIAHELGHLAGNHGRFGAWIYRLRVTWSSIAERTPGWKIIQGFLRWYAPRFNAYSFVLARQHEREADRAAAAASGSDAAATALLRLAVLAPLSERFWTDLRRESARQAQPPAADLLARFDRALSGDSLDASRWIREAMARDNDRRDEHPCLRERLAILGGAALARTGATLPAAGRPRAAHAWFGSSEPRLAQQLDQAWHANFVMFWAQLRARAQELLARRATLEAQVAAGVISVDERWELAVIVRELDGDEAALPSLHSLLQAKPDHPPALFILGEYMLRLGDERGVPLVERAMALDRDLTVAGCEVLRVFAANNGKRDLVAAVEHRGEATADDERRAAIERAKVPDAKRLGPHQLDHSRVDHVASICSSHQEIHCADLVSVTVDALPEKPHFLIVVQIKVPWWKPREASANQELLNRLVGQLSLPGTFLVVTSENKRAIIKQIAKIDGARIYQRQP